MKSSSYSGVSHIVMDQLVKGPLSLAGVVLEVNPIAMALRKEQPKCRADSQKEWACLEYTKRSTACLADPSGSVMRIIHSMAILVILAMPSLIANSLVSGVVVLLARVLENDICWPKFQICIAETACICLEGITLVSVTTTRVEGEEEASRQRWLRDCR